MGPRVRPLGPTLQGCFFPFFLLTLSNRTGLLCTGKSLLRLPKLAIATTPPGPLKRVDAGAGLDDSWMNNDVQNRVWVVAGGFLVYNAIILT